MIIYLDSCAIQRPFDDKSNPKNLLESESVLILLKLMEDDLIQIASSDFLLFELDKIVDINRKIFVDHILKKAKIFIESNDDIIERSKYLMNHGFYLLDSLHISSAEKFKIPYFITTDKNIYNKNKKVQDLKIELISPIQFINEVI